MKLSAQCSQVVFLLCSVCPVPLPSCIVYIALCAAWVSSVVLDISHRSFERCNKIYVSVTGFNVLSLIE